jgi:hypothetical protein
MGSAKRRKKIIFARKEERKIEGPQCCFTTGKSSQGGQRAQEEIFDQTNRQQPEAKFLGRNASSHQQ